LYNHDDTPLATGGLLDLVDLVAKLKESISALHDKYEEEHTKCLVLEVENYRLKERIKKLDHQAYLDGWAKSPDGMGR
jgi:hypothetical protein